MDWRSDAQATIYQVVDKSDPGVWDTWNDILLLCKLHRDQKGWLLEWVPRTANSCADAVAKWARQLDHNIEFSNNFPAFLPFNVLNCISAESPPAPLLCKLLAAVLLCFIQKKKKKNWILYVQVLYHNLYNNSVSS